MQSQWLQEDAIAAYLDEYSKTLATARKNRIKDRDKLAGRLAAIDTEQERILEAIVAGVDPTKLSARSQALAAEAAAIVRQQDSIDADDEVALHPDLAAAYRLRVSSLKLVIDGEGEGALAARNMIRSMIESITCTPKVEQSSPDPNAKRGQNWRAGASMELTVQGQLAQILRIASGQPPKATGAASVNEADTLALVAGVGFEPTTFRL
jgi:site-specific DNA recombinase